MNLTGQSVHRAFVSSFPYLAPDWDTLPSWSKQGYDNVARELNQELEQGEVAISAVLCPQCDTLIEDFKAHACEPYVIRSDWHALQEEL